MAEYEVRAMRGHRKLPDGGTEYHVVWRDASSGVRDSVSWEPEGNLVGPGGSVCLLVFKLSLYSAYELHRLRVVAASSFTRGRSSAQLHVKGRVVLGAAERAPLAKERFVRNVRAVRVGAVALLLADLLHHRGRRPSGGGLAGGEGVANLGAPPELEFGPGVAVEPDRQIRVGFELSGVLGLEERRRHPRDWGAAIHWEDRGGVHLSALTFGFSAPIAAQEPEPQVPRRICGTRSATGTRAQGTRREGRQHPGGPRQDQE